MMTWFLLALISLAQAETCDVRREWHTSVSQRSLLLETLDLKEVLLIGSADISREDRRALIDLFWNSAHEKEAELFEKAKVFLIRYTDAIRQAEENLAYLKRRMEFDPEYFVAVESTESTQPEFAELQKVAPEFFINETVLNKFRPEQVSDVWRKLLLLTLGAPLFLRNSDPQLFGQDELLKIEFTRPRPQVSESPAPPPLLVTDDVEVLQKEAEQATQNMLQSLADNPKSLKIFKRLALLIRPGSAFLKGKSDAQIRKYIMMRTWKPVQKETQMWLDSQLAYIRAKGKPQSSRQEAPQPQSQLTMAPNGRSVAVNLFNEVSKPGISGALFVTANDLYPVASVLSQGCVLALGRK